MTKRVRSLVAGVAGLALLGGAGYWLHLSSPEGAFPAVPGPDDLRADEGPAAVAPSAPSAPPASAAPGAPPPSGALPLPDPVAAPGTGGTSPAARTLGGTAGAPANPGERLAQLRRNALASPAEPLPWVDLGREWMRQGRSDLGRTALRRAWSRARSDADRQVIRRTWTESGLPPAELPDEATPARRRPVR